MAAQPLPPRRAVAALEAVRQPRRAALLLDPTRRRLLESLGEPDSASGIARRLGLPRQRVNYHLRELEREGFVELVEERRKGNCVERVVRATARAFVISPEALGALGLSHEAASDRYSASVLLAAAGRALSDVAALSSRAGAEGKRLATLSLESEIRFASAEARAAFAEELARALARLAARYHDETARGGRRFRLLAAVYPAPPREKEGEGHV